MYLFNRADRKHMWCFPGIKTIAKDLKMSEPTVKRALRDLVSAGFVQKETRWRANGGQSSNLYILKPVENIDDTQCEQAETKSPEMLETPCGDTISADNTVDHPEDTEIPQKSLTQSCVAAENTATLSSADSAAATSTADHPQDRCIFSLFQPVMRLLVNFKNGLSRFIDSKNPAPGHEFTPKVNLSVYHNQKDKKQAEKKKIQFRQRSIRVQE